MLNVSALLRKRGTKFAVGILFLAVVCGLVWIRYRQYAYAAVWHYEHGDFVEIDGHRLRLPQFWWRVDAHAYNTLLVVRAYPAMTVVKPELTISPIMPGEISTSEQGELNITEEIVRSRNQDPAAGQSSLVTLKTSSFTFYCKKEDAGTGGLTIYTNLNCHAANFPYSLTYDGPPKQEKEAELILSTFE